MTEPSLRRRPVRPRRSGWRRRTGRRHELVRSATRRRLPLPERERGRAEHARDEHARVPEQTDRDRLGVGHAERMEEQHERALADTEAAEGDRYGLRHRDGRHERDDGCIRKRQLERPDDAQQRHDDRQLVHDRRADHAEGLARPAAQPVDADVHDADEAHPVVVSREAPGEAGMRGGRQDRDECSDRDRGDAERQERVGVLQQRRPGNEPDDHEGGERDEAGEALDRDRSERGLVRVDGGPEPADPHHVTADRRRQHVADELARERVRGERPEADPVVEDAQDLLPAPGLEHDAAEDQQQRRGEQDRGAPVVVMRDDVVGVRRLQHEQGEHTDAHDDPRHDLPPTRPLGRRDGRWRARLRLGGRRLGHDVRQPTEPPASNRAEAGTEPKVARARPGAATMVHRPRG